MGPALGAKEPWQKCWEHSPGRLGLVPAWGTKELLQKCWEHSPGRLNLVPLKPQYPRIWQSLMIPHLF